MNTNYIAIFQGKEFVVCHSRGVGAEAQPTARILPVKDAPWAKDYPRVETRWVDAGDHFAPYDLSKM